MIYENYVSFETAKLLKEKGFVIPYDSFRGVYINGVFKRLNPGAAYGFNDGDEIVDVCSLQLAMKWLREVHDIYIMIDKDFATENGWHYVIVTKQDWNDNIDNGLIQQESNNYTYEFACEAAIKYCLENLI